MIDQLIRASIKGHLCIRMPERANRESAEFPTTLMVRDEDRLYLQRNWVVETILVKHLLRLLDMKPRHMRSVCCSSEMTPEQNAVLCWAAAHSLTIVTGGPGTGKTFTAAELVKAFSGLRIKIAAPTGKAVDRLLQALLPYLPRDGLVEAATLHRLLELSPGKNSLFQDLFLDADLVLVDEASMIDAALFAHLFASIPDGARLVLFGDADQLPPVQGCGVYADLCRVSSLSLTCCHRADNTQMNALYEAARKGDSHPFVLHALDGSIFDLLDEALGDVSFEEGEDPKKLFTHFDHVRVLCPLRKGPFGVDRINRILLERRQRRGQSVIVPVLITGNDSQLRIYNGTAGVMIRDAVFLSDGRCLPVGQLPGYEVAFALSVHKSQGSEFREVLCVLPPGSEEFGRRVLYTAVTRARNTIRFFGSWDTLSALMTREEEQENGLCDRIKGLQRDKSLVGSP